MISSASSSDPAGRPEQIPAPSGSGPRPVRPVMDRLSTAQAAFLRAEMERQPEIRAEVVARGLTLAANPDYPERDVLRQLAATILQAPDSSETDA
jgi:hypothetical protein